MYTIHDSHIHFKQGKLPPMFFILLGQLDVYIHLTGSRMYPYSVALSESEFLDCLELAQDS